MAYIEVIVLPVKAGELKSYKKLLRESAKAWKRCGALSYHEMLEDDVKPGKHTSFPQSLKLKSDEKVACSYIVFKNKAARNAGWNKFMKDPFVTSFDPKTVSFDRKRMYYGGFKTLVSF